jgi:serine/threonine-protein kinase
MTGPAPAPDDVSISLDFLTPSDWPDSIGRLGSYEIKGVLGRGGMGIVLKAFDPALSRNVAIKVLSAHLATSGPARRRFLREARAAAAVVHEHVVGVFAVVESVGLPFLVMEYVPGRTLQERVDSAGPPELAEILRIGSQTAAGLAAAHEQGLIHRDVKPANILLENGVERVRLTDFGLARAAADAALTHSGVISGTPHYMAPEQATGESIDHRADLFSLGSTLYAMCAGHPPFRAESPLGVIRRVCDDRPRPLREVNPEVPAWLEAIIARLMAKDPKERYESAAEVAHLLGSCLAHVQQPLSVALPAELVEDPTRSPTRPIQLRRAGIAAIALAAAGAALVLFALRQAPRSELSNSAALLQRPAAASAPVAIALAGPPAGTDEIAQSIQEARDFAAAIETGLRQREHIVQDDLISRLAHGLAEQAQTLESQMSSTRDADRWNPFPRSISTPVPRR